MILIPNTFGLKSEVKQVVDIANLTSDQLHSPWFTLGSGSNVILPETLDATLIKTNAKAIKLIKTTSDHYHIRIDSACSWHQLVLTAISQNWHGIENLIAIPGTVGAAPVQNIGAYGVELSESILAVETIHIPTLERFYLNKDECEFSYRSSIFKTQLTDHIITAVVLKLKKHFHPIIPHKDLDQLQNCNAKIFASKIANIRSQKLPDPNINGNAGSFFKNPIVPIHKIPKDCMHYPLGEGMAKLSAAALIETAGLKGMRIGDAAVSAKHALVLINLGNAKYTEITELVRIIQTTIQQEFAINLEPEVKIIAPELLPQPQVQTH